nr:hypothetical protein [Tanacetum cinerariifolium]
PTLHSDHQPAQTLNPISTSSMAALRYALNHDLIIFDSLVKQFQSTTTLRAPELGPPAILATIDKTPYTITEDLPNDSRCASVPSGVASVPTGSFVPTGCSLPTGFIDFLSG